MPGLTETLREYLALPAGGVGADTKRWLELRKQLRELLDSTEVPCPNCNLPQSTNPHPDAGKPAALGYIGARHGCLACAEKRASGRHDMWVDLYAWLQRADEADAMVHPGDVLKKMLVLDGARRTKLHDSCRQMQEVPDETETVPGG